MPNNNGEWKISSARFQGYVKSSLESIDKRLDKHDNHFEKIYSEIEKQKLFHERVKIKLGIIAAGAGGFFAIAWHFISRMIK